MRRILAAAFEWRTLIWLGAGIVASVALSNPFPAVIGLGVYLWFVKRLAASPEFAQAAEQARTAERMEEKYKELQETARRVIAILPSIVPVDQHRSWVHRATDVVSDARQVYHDWLSRPAQKQAEQAAVVEDALQMAYLYLRILSAHQALRPQKPSDRAAIEERVRRNQQKLEASQDLETRSLLAQAIEMDQRVLTQEEQEAAGRERYLAKLAAIESAMDLLRRQLTDPELSPEGLNVRDMLLEAQAMDEALTEVQNVSRIRSRA